MKTWIASLHDLIFAPTNPNDPEFLKLSDNDKCLHMLFTIVVMGFFGFLLFLAG
ncbi:MAG: hypothetical protein POELPBGB_01384 [Bacteroidia bacterium]|nr:hypothetical protein [Bacteroidia bacterium]